jgi:uncharacterized protein YjiS (DUF1127 family)
MACIYKDNLERTSLQTEPILPGGKGFLKVFRFVGNVLLYAFELSEACNRMLQRQRGRQALRELDDHQLEDIGLTRAQANRAARKWFWQ